MSANSVWIRAAAVASKNEGHGYGALTQEILLEGLEADLLKERNRFARRLLHIDKVVEQALFGCHMVRASARMRSRIRAFRPLAVTTSTRHGSRSSISA